MHGTTGPASPWAEMAEQMIGGTIKIMDSPAIVTIGLTVLLGALVLLLVQAIKK